MFLFYFFSSKSIYFARIRFRPSSPPTHPIDLHSLFICDYIYDFICDFIWIAPMNSVRLTKMFSKLLLLILKPSPCFISVRTPSITFEHRLIFDHFLFWNFFDPLRSFLITFEHFRSLLIPLEHLWSSTTFVFISTGGAVLHKSHFLLRFAVDPSHFEHRLLSRSVL